MSLYSASIMVSQKFFGCVNTTRPRDDSACRMSVIQLLTLVEQNITHISHQSEIEELLERLPKLFRHARDPRIGRYISEWSCAPLKHVGERILIDVNQYRLFVFLKRFLNANNATGLADLVPLFDAYSKLNEKLPNKSPWTLDHIPAHFEDNALYLVLFSPPINDVPKLFHSIQTALEQITTQKPRVWVFYTQNGQRIVISIGTKENVFFTHEYIIHIQHGKRGDILYNVIAR